MRRMTRIGFAALAASVLLLGCSDDSNSPSRNALLRVVHASPDAPAVDVLLDGKVVLNNVAYQAFSGYLTVPAGTRNVKVNAAGTSTTVLDLTGTLKADSAYTVVAFDQLSNLQALGLDDDLSDPAAGNVKVRLVHGSPTAGTVDIYVTAPGADLTGLAPTLSQVDLGVESGYLEVPAGDYQVRITPTGSKTPALDTGTLTLTAGQIRTAIAVDAPGGGLPLGVILMPDKN